VTTRGLLFAGLASLAFIGVVASVLPLLRYGAAGRAPVLAVDIADLAPGQFRVVDRAADRLYVLRPAADALIVLWVPLRDGAVVLPDPRWDGSSTQLCRDFGPDRRGRELPAGAAFACRDTPVPAVQPHWDTDGHYRDDSAVRLDAIPAPHYTRMNSAILVRLPRPLP